MLEWMERQTAVSAGVKPAAAKFSWLGWKRRQEDELVELDGSEKARLINMRLQREKNEGKEKFRSQNIMAKGQSDQIRQSNKRAIMHWFLRGRDDYEELQAATRLHSLLAAHRSSPAQSLEEVERMWELYTTRSFNTPGLEAWWTPMDRIHGYSYDDLKVSIAKPTTENIWIGTQEQGSHLFLIDNAINNNVVTSDVWHEGTCEFTTKQHVYCVEFAMKKDLNTPDRWFGPTDRHILRRNVAQHDLLCLPAPIEHLSKVS
jgi:hypothetical protein